MENMWEANLLETSALLFSSLYLILWNEITLAVLSKEDNGAENKHWQ